MLNDESDLVDHWRKEKSVSDISKLERALVLFFGFEL